MDAHATSSPAIYRKVLGALLSLTIVTVLAAGIDFGTGNAVIALAIATVKASLVALFFMHLRHDKPMNAVIFIAGVTMLGIFLLLTYVDVGTRSGDKPVPSRPFAHSRIDRPVEKPLR